MTPDEVHSAGGVVQLVGLTKAFDDVEAVARVSLDIAEGEFFSLLGPSGCGKTTTLRMIGGFERPDGGEIRVGAQPITDIPPHKRPVNTVFQSYALFPFLSVADNIAFGFRFSKAPRAEVKSRVAEMIELTQLQGLEKRHPHQLSGGQQQRVALARALSLRPKVLLLDEPLGALDAKLRRALQIELKDLQRRVGITFIYVTHDQEEALTMSDRLAVMNSGRVEQVGTPRELYEAPETKFVAEFLGASNILSGRCHGENRIELAGTEFRAAAGHGDRSGASCVTIRPERVTVSPDAEQTSENSLVGVVDHVVYAGSATRVRVCLADGQLLHALALNEGAELPYREGDRVRAHLPPGALRVLAEDPAG